jgi:AraC-like DNA-binding protein
MATSRSFATTSCAKRARPGLEWALAAGDFQTFDSRVFETFDAVSASSQRGEGAPRRGRLRAEHTKRFIERHAFEPIVLGDIAASVGLSPFVCLRQFKAHAGVTPHAYRNALRVREAQRLLAATDRPIAIVGAAVGIDDPFYFARWFSRARRVRRQASSGAPIDRPLCVMRSRDKHSAAQAA